MHVLSSFDTGTCQPWRTRDPVSSTPVVKVPLNEVAMPPISRCQSGFTLIEVMIVVMIIAILSAIAIPQYQQYIVRSKLTDAMNNLSAERVLMEQYYQDNRQYACPAAGDATKPPLPQMKYFTFACALGTDASGNANAQAYTLTAKGLATDSQVSGFTYTLDNTNAKSSVGPANWGGTQASCWITNKGGC
ncbi:type IV pilin protein [Dyella jiangningensis]|uniref:type IV pilin protein n=1 Tax=Dyella jiangningensis TaxID=1379159 RepID=UPI00240EA9DD|nr:type IV pilin protein [Dyella jiangningensis]MDG2537284.1 type IV pilin protein [Dyella jiangningensis]